VGRRLAELVGVEGAQERIAGHTEIEAVHEVAEEGLTPDSIEQRVHDVESRGRRLHARSRP
jgi:hypothetical protein